MLVSTQSKSSYIILLIVGLKTDIDLVLFPRMIIHICVYYTARSVKKFIGFDTVIWEHSLSLVNDL